jgi:hypothetical protein
MAINHNNVNKVRKNVWVILHHKKVCISQEKISQTCVKNVSELCE